MPSTEPYPRVLVIGAGPAGLTAAHTLTKSGVPVMVLEADPRYVGGIARTVVYKDFRFDIGGHRFFTKSAEVAALWREMLPEGMLERPRQSRIFYGGKLFDYPLRAGDALGKLGIVEALRSVASYARARAFPIRDPRSFEDWVINQFGERLFRTFFKTYTEKVWGMPCTEIAAAWAAQRIKGLSLASAVRNAFRPAPTQPGNGRAGIKTLIHSFQYPARGPGMLWESCAEQIGVRGGKILMGHRVTGLEFDARARLWTARCVRADGSAAAFQAHHVVSTAALRDLVPHIQPAFSEAAIEAARCLRYRDFLIVALILKDRQIFPDNWIYVHDAGVKVGRIQNFKAWSPEMVPDPAYCCYGMEYFCFEGDRLWQGRDEELIERAGREIEFLGLASARDVVDAAVVRQPKAYPVYDHQHAAHVAAIREEIDERFPTLHVAGRNGMHFYNSQDHSMMTAVLAAENIMAGRRVHNVWAVTDDAEYAEESRNGHEVLADLRAGEFR